MRRRTRKQLPKLIASCIALAVCTGGLGYVAMQSIGKRFADEYGCFDGVSGRQTVVLVDASEPRWDSEQGRSLRTYLDQLYAGLGFNEKLSVYTTEGDEMASVVSPRFHICGQATRPEQLVSINADAAQAGFLKRQKQKLYKGKFAPKLDALLSANPDKSRLQLYQSPILETLRSISYAVRLQTADRLILIGDLLQNSESARFCKVANDMPLFRHFKKRLIYRERLQPQSLQGVTVEVLMLLRFEYGQGSLKHCSSEEELRGWWRNYFVDNGVVDPRFIRIRQGMGE